MFRTALTAFTAGRVTRIATLIAALALGVAAALGTTSAALDVADTPQHCGSSAVTSAGDALGGFDLWPDLPFYHYGVAHWQYPDANGNCPAGWSKQSVYSCQTDESYNVTCGNEDRCYPTGN